MHITKNAIWKMEGSTGILMLQGSQGNYLEEPGFIPVRLLTEIFSEPGLKAVIIKGSGRHFSAGASLDHLKKLSTDEALMMEKMNMGKELLRMIDSADIPVAAEINGVCFGGGLEIALACHFRICSENALFAFPEVNYGIMPGLGGTIRLSRLIGPGKAARMILSGDIFDAAQALELRLVDNRVPAPELHISTLNFLNKLTEGREIAVIHSVMKSIRNSFTMVTDKALEEETRLFCALAASNFITE